MRIAEMEGGNRMRMEERLWELEERLTCLGLRYDCPERTERQKLLGI